jgi:predicted permease
MEEANRRRLTHVGHVIQPLLPGGKWGRLASEISAMSALPSFCLSFSFDSICPMTVLAALLHILTGTTFASVRHAKQQSPLRGGGARQEKLICAIRALLFVISVFHSTGLDAV